MGVPKKKRSKSRKKSRQVKNPASLTLSFCPQCKAPVLPHFACPECGYYRGEQVGKVKEEEKEKKKKKEKS